MHTLSWCANNYTWSLFHRYPKPTMCRESFIKISRVWGENTLHYPTHPAAKRVTPKPVSVAVRKKIHFITIPHRIASTLANMQMCILFISRRVDLVNAIRHWIWDANVLKAPEHSNETLPAGPIAKTRIRSYVSVERVCVNVVTRQLLQQINWKYRSSVEDRQNICGTGLIFR